MHSPLSAAAGLSQEPGRSGPRSGDVSALPDRGDVFTVGTFSQLGYSPPISALSDRGSIFTFGFFSQLGFLPPISALSDGGSIFTVGIASTDLS